MCRVGLLTHSRVLLDFCSDDDRNFELATANIARINAQRGHATCYDSEYAVSIYLPAIRRSRRRPRYQLYVPHSDAHAMNYPCAKFGDFSFSRFDFIVRTDRQTESASVILSVCLCQHDKIKTAETKIAKLGTGIVHYDTSPIN